MHSDSEGDAGGGDDDTADFCPDREELSGFDLGTVARDSEVAKRGRQVKSILN